MFKQTIPLLAFLALAMSPVVSSSPASAQGEAKSNQFWWPQQLDLSPLRDHGVESNPLGEDFNYAEAFKRRWPGKTLALLTAPDPLWWYIIDEAIPIAARLRRDVQRGLHAGGLESGTDMLDQRHGGPASGCGVHDDVVLHGLPRSSWSEIV